MPCPETKPFSTPKSNQCPDSYSHLILIFPYGFIAHIKTHWSLNSSFTTAWSFNIMQWFIWKILAHWIVKIFEILIYFIIQYFLESHLLISPPIQWEKILSVGKPSNSWWWILVFQTTIFTVSDGLKWQAHFAHFVNMSVNHPSMNNHCVSVSHSFK